MPVARTLAVLVPAVLVPACGATAALAQAGGYPSKPIRWVVPFAAGGGTDVVVRPIAQRLTERWGQSILYDNRGGGGGVIAGEIVAKSQPDGYTFLVPAVAVMTVNVSLMKLPFDPVKDFAPVTKFATVPNMLVARPALPIRAPQDIVSYAKANPGKLVWAISGIGSGGHLAMEQFRLATGIRFVHVPYKGAGPANVAVQSNEADVLFANPGVFLPHIKAGRLTAVGVASLERIALLPDLPTFHESGFPGFESSSWYGLAAPAGTPAAIVAFVQKEIATIMKDPDIAARLAADGAIPVANSPAAFAKEIRDDIAKWAQIIKAANIRL